MKKLISQILKFGFIGGLCFVIDFSITTLLAIPLRQNFSIATAAMIGGFFGFTISVLINYKLSMQYVFTDSKIADKKHEFLIFLIISIVGLLINEIILKTTIDFMLSKTNNFIFIQKPNKSIDDQITIFAKLIATFIVMIYNFITKKLFLEKKAITFIQN